MKLNYLLLVILLLAFMITSCSKNKDNGSSDPDVKIISGNFSFNDGHGTLCETWDNGFVIATRYGRNGMYLAKTNRSFDLTWSFNHASSIGYVGGIAESEDHGYVVVNNFIDTTFHPDKLYVDLIKVDPAGKLAWDKKYNLDYLYCSGFSIRKTNDNGFIVATENNGQIVLLKVNSSGDSLWTKVCAHDEPWEGFDVQVASDNGFVVVGGSAIVRTDSLGNVMWSKQFQGEFTNVKFLTDGSCVAFGSKNVSSYADTNQMDYALEKYDAGGTKLWEKTFNISSQDRSENLCLTPDGGFIFSGNSEFKNSDLMNILVIRTDASGNQVAMRYLDNTQGSIAYGLIFQSGSYVYYGSTLVPGSLDCYLVMKRFTF